jgi:hypothetical protein
MCYYIEQFLKMLNCRIPTPLILFATDLLLSTTEDEYATDKVKPILNYYNDTCLDK